MNRPFRNPLGILCTAAAVAYCGVVLAQSSNQQPAAGARTKSGTAENAERLISDLDSLSRLRKQLADQLKSTSPGFSPLTDENPANAPVSSTTDGASASRLKSLLQEFDSASQEANGRVSTLREKVDELKALMNQRPNPGSSDSTGARPAGPSDDNAADSASPPEPMELRSPPEKAEPSRQDPAQAKPVSSDHPVVVTGTVDRLALADSLFGSGEVPLALEIYNALSLESHGQSDAEWIQYQLAACHRKLGDRSAAEKTYRLVAGQSNAGLLAENAKWWLRQIQERRQMEEFVSRLKQSRIAIQEQFNEPGQK